MHQWLNTGTKEERVQRIISLGVKPESAKLAVADEVQWRAMRGRFRSETAILFIPCFLNTASMSVLENTGQHWHASDTVSLDCHYDDSLSFEVASLRVPRVDDVLIHHDCKGHGTGILQQNFEVFAIVSSKFKAVLSTEEILKVSGWPGAREIDQQSSFVVSTTRSDGSKVIEETRRKLDNGSLTVERRGFHWSLAEFRFLPTEFVTVQ